MIGVSENANKQNSREDNQYYYYYYYYINGFNLIRRVKQWRDPSKLIHLMIHVKWNNGTSLSRPLVNNGESEERIRFHFSSFAIVIPSEKGPAKAIFASYTEKTYINACSWLGQKQMMLNEFMFRFGYWHCRLTLLLVKVEKHSFTIIALIISRSKVISIGSLPSYILKKKYTYMIWLYNAPVCSASWNKQKEDMSGCTWLYLQ